MSATVFNYDNETINAHWYQDVLIRILLESTGLKRNYLLNQQCSAFFFKKKCANLLYWGENHNFLFGT